jgi:aspartokinase/homoserine dehydrogenase 1
MKILKFGGTSVGTTESFSEVIKIISKKIKEDKIIVVVSALGGITDKLIAAVGLAAKKEISYKEEIAKLRTKHYEFLIELIPTDQIAETRVKIDKIFQMLEDKLHGIFLLGECTLKSKDTVISLGEQLSKTLMVFALNGRGIKAVDFDAAEFIRTNSIYGNADVDFESTNKLIEKKFKDINRHTVPIVNGFTGTDKNGNITTLGRSGSDYTATIIAGALEADAVEIWTDVDGILSADPRIVNDAEAIKELNYKDSAELTFLGARVIFPKAMNPVRNKNIPIIVLNTFNSEFEGTVICERPGNFSSEVISITSLNHLSLVSLSNITEEINYSVLFKIITALNRHHLPIISLNHSLVNRAISILTYSQRINELIEDLQIELKPELEHDVVRSFSHVDDISLVTIIGNKTDNQPETFKKISDTLENLNIDSLIYLNGTEGKNYSFLVDRVDTKEVITALHKTFFKSLAKTNVA